MDVSELFHEFATALELDSNDQIAILLGYIQDHAEEGLAGFLTVLQEELTRPPPAAKQATTAPATAVPTQPLAEMTNFFDRSLARSALNSLVKLPGMFAFEREGYEAVRLLVPPAEWQATLAVLSGENVARAAPGTILGGWYYTFSDGSVGFVALTQGSTEQAPYLDAVLILPDGVHPTSPNISLDPIRTLEEDFVFQYPDGTYKVIRLSHHNNGG